jgi:hypothetical protein
MPIYHDLHITTSKIERKSIFDLPFSVLVTCTRTGGWEVWSKDGPHEELLGAEFGGPDKWLVLDVAGHEICNGRDR